MTQQFTIVIPIKINVHHSHNELCRFLQIQLRSLNKFLNISSVYEFLIICKQDETCIVEKALSEHLSPLPIRVITENVTVNEQVIKNMSTNEYYYNRGWYLQQLIKLGVARIIKTPLYLILDTDCFLTKPLAYKDLFHKGKILIDKTSWTFRPNWWLDALKIIDDLPLSRIASEPVMNMTPQILVTDIVCELLDYLNQKDKSSNWDEYLSTKTFTEFSLYWAFLLKTNRTDLYNLSGSGPSLLGNAISEWASFLAWRERSFTLTKQFKAIFNKRLRREQQKIKWKKEQAKYILEQVVKTEFENNDHFYFSLIQSNIHELPVDWIIQQTSKYLT